jgi:hypothetical protein
MNAPKSLLRRFADSLATIALGVAAGYGLGALFVWLWAPTPTPETPVRHRRPFLFLWGALIGFFVVILARVLLVPLWLRRRHRFG